MNLLNSLYRTLFHTYERYDLSPWQHTPTNTRPIYGVYHVFCARGWQRLVADQYCHLKRSGLLEHTDKLFVSCIIFQETDVEELRVKAPLWVLRVVTTIGEYMGRITGKISALNNDKYNILKQRNWQCDITPAQQELGYAPQYNLERGVKETIAWYKQEGWL